MTNQLPPANDNTPSKFDFLVTFFLILFPLGAAFYSSSTEALNALNGMYHFSEEVYAPLKGKNLLTNPLSVKRAIQQHFRHYGTYIPIENIILKSEQDQPLYAESVRLLVSSSKSNEIWIFVPLHFRLPFFGDKVMDYLYVPSWEVTNTNR